MFFVRYHEYDQTCQWIYNKKDPTQECSHLLLQSIFVGFGKVSTKLGWSDR